LTTTKKYSIRINQELCKSCGICYWICPAHAIVQGKMNAPRISDQDACIGCRQCERACPDFAIDINERKDEGGNG